MFEHVLVVLFNFVAIVTSDTRLFTFLQRSLTWNTAAVNISPAEKF